MALSRQNQANSPVKKDVPHLSRQVVTQDAHRTIVSIEFQTDPLPDFFGMVVVQLGLPFPNTGLGNS
jgi:hypothetical protein